MSKEGLVYYPYSVNDSKRNNMPCKTDGVRIVRVRVHDSTLRTLVDVRYVPEFKKNLLLWLTLLDVRIGRMWSLEDFKRSL